MTDEMLVEKLRVSFQRVQQSKRGDAPLDMQPVWDIINAVPSVIALLDKHEEFERDLEAEEAADRLSSLEEEKRVLTRALREVDFNLNGLPEAMRLAMPHQAGTADALQQLLVTVRTALSAGVGR